MPSLAAALWFLLSIRATGIDGKPVDLFDGQSRAPTVLVFLRTDCPISNRYAPELKRLYERYSARVMFYAVYADTGETADAVRKHTKEYDLTLPVQRDPGHVLVRAANVRVTPEAAVFSAGGTLVYHGRIDNRYVEFGKAMPQPTKHDLQDAIEATLAGKSVKPDSTRAIGCSLADAR